MNNKDKQSVQSGRERVFQHGLGGEIVNQEFLLLAEFEVADIPLGKVAAKYLALDEAQAKKKAKQNALPFPVFRVGTQKAEWFVSIKDLAEYLHKEREAARREWLAISSARQQVSG